jgi:hypothetical protein
MLLLMLNNFIYYSRFGIQYLPLLQKITFQITLSWIFALNVRLIRIRKEANREER